MRTTDARHALTLFEKAEERGQGEEKGANNPAGGYEDRSAPTFAFVTMALRHRIDRSVIAGRASTPAHRGHAIYQHGTDSGGVEYVERQINRAQTRRGSSSETRTARSRIKSQQQPSRRNWASRRHPELRRVQRPNAHRRPSSVLKNVEIGASAIFLPWGLGQSGRCEQTLTYAVSSLGMRIRL